MLKTTLKQQTNVALGAVQKHIEKTQIEKTSNLTSRGNGKRSLESAVKMLLSAAIFGICYFVSVFIAICSDLLLFDATCCYVLPLAAARC